MSRRRYASPPAWSSWACVSTTPSTRSAFSRRYVKSGSTRSTPGMSASGNIKPQSTTRMRPPTSRQKQLRPISPSPPRKTMRAGSFTAVRLPPLLCDRASVARDLVEVGVLLARVDPVLELDHAELLEAMPEPAVGGVEEAELLAVGHDLREQHRLEERAVGRVQRHVHHVTD